MNSTLLKKSVFFLLTALLLSGCGTPLSSSSSPAVSSTPEATSTSDTAASSSETPASTASVCSNFMTSLDVDYVSQAKLTSEYSGKHFLVDGIGPVKLKEKIDGDTAHFQQFDGDTSTIKGRYLCIDTPESTGMVEEWGHGASEYNGTMLANAKTIVLSSDSTAATKPALDSTGSRFLVYVWVSAVENGDISTFKLVNLALVQDGWSKAKGATGTDYGSLFISASSQAQTAKIHLWSNEKDCDFNYDSPSTTTIKEIVDGVGVDGKPFDWTGAKATFTGIVTATGPDKGAAFVNKDFTWDENGTSVSKRYGIYVFTSYVEYAPLKAVGNEVQITGLIASYSGILQVVGVSYSPYYPEDDDMKILSTGNVLTPLTGTAKELAIDQNINVVCKATLDCTGGYATQNAATQTAYAFTLYCQDETASLNIYIVDSIYVSYAYDYGTHKKGERVQGTDGVSYFKDATSLTITGGLVTYTTTKGVKTYQIKLCHAADLVVTY